jgi:hypothetical protein
MLEWLRQKCRAETLFRSRLVIICDRAELHAPQPSRYVVSHWGILGAVPSMSPTWDFANRAASFPTHHGVLGTQKDGEKDAATAKDRSHDHLKLTEGSFESLRGNGPQLTAILDYGYLSKSYDQDGDLQLSTPNTHRCCKI